MKRGNEEGDTDGDFTQLGPGIKEETSSIVVHISK